MEGYTEHRLRGWGYRKRCGGMLVLEVGGETARLILLKAVLLLNVDSKLQIFLIAFSEL